MLEKIFDEKTKRYINNKNNESGFDLDTNRNSPQKENKENFGPLKDPKRNLSPLENSLDVITNQSETNTIGTFRDPNENVNKTSTVKNLIEKTPKESTPKSALNKPILQSNGKKSLRNSTNNKPIVNQTNQTKLPNDPKGRGRGYVPIETKNSEKRNTINTSNIPNDKTPKNTKRSVETNLKNKSNSQTKINQAVYEKYSKFPNAESNTNLLNISGTSNGTNTMRNSSSKQTIIYNPKSKEILNSKLSSNKSKNNLNESKS